MATTPPPPPPEVKIPLGNLSQEDAIALRDFLLKKYPLAKP